MGAWGGKGFGAVLIEDWNLDLEARARRTQWSIRGARKPPKLVHNVIFSMPPSNRLSESGDRLLAARIERFMGEMPPVRTEAELNKEIHSGRDPYLTHAIEKTR